ncbi:MAG TPA: glycoside hydrolase family 15 protein, partial [Devosia sp.]|nr:glycoside hydrolase family 15 protein [Devosia sp.]
AQHDIAGYYVRLGPRASEGGLRGKVDVRNVAQGSIAASELVGLEFLYLVRTGLRAPDDPRILDTLKLVETMLRRETPNGPSYYRYNGDGYGEHADGGPFDGTGIGRLWPLLTGERGHYAVVAGEDAKPYLGAMARMTGPGGLIPEQIWDADPIPSAGLRPGHPSGSAMPLVWAHAEFIKLLAAQANGRPVELLDGVESRYGGQVPAAARWHWREASPFTTMPAGRALLIECTTPFALMLGFDDAPVTLARSSAPTAFGMHGVELLPDALAGHASMAFAMIKDGATAPGPTRQISFAQ